MLHRIIGFSLVAISALGMVGCAGLEYVKVPTPTQYSKWSDEMQKQADAMKGVRYYLPRPFLALKQSTPVAQRVAFVSFHYDAQKKAYVLDLPQDAPRWVKRVAPAQLSITQALAATLAGEATPKQPGGGRQESGIAGGEEDKGGTGGAIKPGPDTAPKSNVPSELHARTGFISDTDPITRLGDRMDVVYLPDFEEQFVIQAHTGLGKGDIETKLRNGWAAEVFAQKVDNSNLVPYVIDQVQKASDAAAGIFTTWAPLAAGLPPGLKLPSTGKMESATAGGGGAEAGHNFLGDVLLFKIAEVKVAQPGLYPILKPREIKQWLKFEGVVAANDPDASLEDMLRLSGLLWVRPDMAFIPCPPFTVIGFNATTDVFIMPATDRLTEASADNKQKGTPDKNVTSDSGGALDAKIIEGALNAKKSELGSAASKLTNVTATSPDGASTEIVVTFNSALAPQENVDAVFTKWLSAAFELKQAQLSGFKRTTSADAKTVTISSTMGLSSLADLKKKD